MKRPFVAECGPDGEHLYPAFPYTSFTKINDADLRALYDYFMSLKSGERTAQGERHEVSVQPALADGGVEHAVLR